MANGKMKPGEATECIRKKCGPDLTLHWTQHAKDRLAERDLTMGDVLHVLRFGFVHDDAEPSTRPTAWKYRMECVTPNSGGRTVRIVVIPFATSCDLKVVTVMWADERL
jgi:hypothetical protein